MCVAHTNTHTWWDARGPLLASGGGRERRLSPINLACRFNSYFAFCFLLHTHTHTLYNRYNTWDAVQTSKSVCFFCKYTQNYLGCHSRVPPHSACTLQKFRCQIGGALWNGAVLFWRPVVPTAQQLDMCQVDLRIVLLFRTIIASVWTLNANHCLTNEWSEWQAVPVASQRLCISWKMTGDTCFTCLHLLSLNCTTITVVSHVQ